MASLKSDVTSVKKNDYASLIRDMKDIRVNASDLKSELEDRFLTRLDLAHKILGRGTFKIATKKKISSAESIASKDKHSPPLFDAIMIALDRLYPHAKALIPHGKEIAKEFKAKLDNDDEFYALIVGRANTADSVKKRIAVVEQLFRTYL